MPVLKTCCCGCELVHGVTVYGYLGLVWSFFQIIGAGSVLTGHYLPPGEEYIGEAVIGLGIMNFFTFALMLRGAQRGYVYYLIPWLAVNAIAIIVYFVIVAIYGANHIRQKNQVAGGAILCTGISFVALSAYLWVCVLSYYQELRGNPCQRIDSPTMVLRD